MLYPLSYECICNWLFRQLVNGTGCSVGRREVSRTSERLASRGHYATVVFDKLFERKDHEVILASGLGETRGR